jgi:hypothetical protein
MVKEKIVHPLKNVCHEKIDKKYIELFFFVCVNDGKVTFIIIEMQKA